MIFATLSYFQVRPVKASDYHYVSTQDRQGGLIFYGPRSSKRNQKDEQIFEIVVLAERSDQGFW